MNTFETAKALFMQGIGEIAQEDWGNAEKCFRESLRLLPGRASTLNNLAAALIKLEKFQDAESIAVEALQIDPSAPEAWINQGLVLNATGDFASATDSFDKAIDLAPGNAEAWSNRGVALAGLGRHEESLLAYRRALELRPNYHEAWCNRGTALSELDRYDEALASYDRAIELKPCYPQAYNNKGLALVELGLDDAASACFSKALELRPNFADPHWNLGLLHIRHTDYSLGWKYFEYRWGIKGNNSPRLATSKPRWAGLPSGRPLLLWGEQGIGDQILYGSILPDLAAFPQKKYVALDKRLVPLFQRSMPEFEFLDLALVTETLDFAEHLPLGSLPALFRPTLASFNAARHPYLVADPERASTLRRLITRPGKLVCGVSWSSSHKDIGSHKSIGLAQMLLPLASERLHFVNLQYGDTTAEREALCTAHGLEVQNVDEVDNFNDIDGLTALIEACDIVLTTSNSTAHLAGALRKTTLLLLPSGKGRLWYWYGPQGNSPWYPSIRMYSQEHPGQWQHPLARIKSYLS